MANDNDKDRPPVSVSELDPKFKFEISDEPGGENIRACFACGTCAAGCPVREVNERYNPRKIIRKALLGFKDEVLSSDFIWLCSACYTCQERCPQDVKIADLMTAMKNLAVKAGHVHPAYRAQVTQLKGFGKMYEIDEFDNRKREKAGLPKMSGKPDAVAKILEMVGIADLDA